MQLERDLHIGNTSIGLLVTVSTAVGAVATLPIGALTDRINRTNLLAGAILIWSVAMVVSGASTSFEMLLLTRLALGAVVATAGPTVASLTGDLFPAAERGRIYGFILTGELIGTGIGFLVSGDIAAVLSWRYAFWVLAVPGVILAWAIWRLLPEPARGGQSRLQAGDELIRSATQVAREQPAPARGGDSAASTSPRGEDEGKVAREVQKQAIAPHEDLVLDTDPAGKSLWWAVRYVLSVRTKRVLILASALGYFFFSGLRTFAVVFPRDRFGVAQGVASILLVVIGVGAIVGVLATGRLGDWLIERRHITARPLVGGLSFLLAAALFLPGPLTTSLLVAATVAVLRRRRGRRGEPTPGRRSPGHNALPPVGPGRSRPHRAPCLPRGDRPAAVRLRLHPIRRAHQRAGQPHRRRRTRRIRTGRHLPHHAHAPHRHRPAPAAACPQHLPPRRRHRAGLRTRHPPAAPAGLRYRARPGHRETNPAMIMRNEPHPAGELPPSPPAAAAAFAGPGGGRK